MMHKSDAYFMHIHASWSLTVPETPDFDKNLCNIGLTRDSTLFCANAPEGRMAQNRVESKCRRPGIPLVIIILLYIMHRGVYNIYVCVCPLYREIDTVFKTRPSPVCCSYKLLNASPKHTPDG